MQLTLPVIAALYALSVNAGSHNYLYYYSDKSCNNNIGEAGLFDNGDCLNVSPSLSAKTVLLDCDAISKIY